MIEDTECPYCGKWQEINHNDGYGYDESIVHEQQCYDCEKYFTFTTSISFSYESGKADCLNGKDHKFKPSHTTPKNNTKMICSDCDKRRELTNIEWLDFMAPMETITGWHK